MFSRLQSAAILTCLTLLVGCVGYSNYQWAGTFTYEGNEYPVYSAMLEVGGSKKNVFLLFLPMQGPGSNDSFIATCDKPDLVDCSPAFGRAIANRLSGFTGQPEGGMDY